MNTATATAGETVLTTPSDRSIRIERTFEAPREKVWNAFTRPELVARWWGRGNRLEIERLELARGGRWRYVEYSTDGSDGFEGRFREVVPPTRLVQSFEWDGMPAHVAITTETFEEVGGTRTRVITHMLFHTAEERDGMLESGMQKGMDAGYAVLDRILAEPP